jgi:hypothetical protein
MRRGGERPRGGLMRRGGGDLRQAMHRSHQCQVAGLPCHPHAASSLQPKAPHPCHATRPRTCCAACRRQLPPLLPHACGRLARAA